MNIAEIARLITEDPDLFNDAPVLTEAPDSFYIPSFNKSQTPVPSNLDMSHLGWVQGIGAITVNWETKKPEGAYNGWLPPGAEQAAGADSLNTRSGSMAVNRGSLVMKMKDLPQEERLKIVHAVKAIVPPEFVKYEPYYMSQAIGGKLPLDFRLREDGSRLTRTIQLFIKFSRKAIWDGEKDLFKYPDWRLLERKLMDMEESYIDYDETADSEVMFTKKYVNNAISLLLGGPPEVTTYWFRTVANPEAACKYGKGTQWCTSMDLAPRGTPEYEQHYANSYIKSGGLYIIEMESPAKKRHPILQISGDQFMDVNDTPISRVGPRLQDFFTEVLKVAGDKLHPLTANHLATYSDNATRMKYAELRAARWAQERDEAEARHQARLQAQAQAQGQQ